MLDLAGKRVTVAGLGLHGGAVGNIRWLHEQGATVLVTDLKPANDLQETLAILADLSDITYILGKHRVEDFTGVDMVLQNPAVPRGSKYLVAAREASVPVTMDSNLFFEYCPTTDIIGVTGSKGKSTTTHALVELLRLGERPVVMIGVEGTSVLAALDAITPDTVVVFELSSWRLEMLGEEELSPATAVVTSLYRDHLNTYASFEAYVAAKKQIFLHQQSDNLVLLNYDDELVRAFAAEAPGKVAWYSTEAAFSGEGICLKDGVVQVVSEGERTVLWPADVLGDRGEHERRNLLPALYLAHQAGVKPAQLSQAIQKLPRLPHRMERVREVAGVTYINDSTATIPDATIAAVQSMPKTSLVLILGGDDKKLEFEELAQVLTTAKIREIFWLPGSATPALRQALQRAGVGPPGEEVSTILEAVEASRAIAQSGDVVLLSPGATSFGSWRHEFERGDAFRDAVQSL